MLFYEALSVSKSVLSTTPLSVLWQVRRGPRGARGDRRRPGVHGAQPPVLRALLRGVRPAPATCLILRVLKAGEAVYQRGEVPKTLFMHYEVVGTT